MSAAAASSTESRSDIFFLEVKPYEEEFVASDSNAGGDVGPQETGLEELIAQQKDIMAATWKLDARARRGGAGVQSAADIRSVAQAQSGLKAKTEEVAAQMSAGMAAQRRRRGPGTLTRPGDDPLPHAIEAMGRAAGELDRLKVAPALPHEEQALAELLKAAAEIRRRQVAMQQANGGGGNGNRQSPDLSTLFDQELRKQQQTNYEQQSTTADAAQQNQTRRTGSARRDSRAGAPAGGTGEAAARSRQEQGPDERRRSEAAARTTDARSGRAAASRPKSLRSSWQASAAVPTGSSRFQQGSTGRGEPAVARRVRSRCARLPAIFGSQDPQQASARGVEGRRRAARPRAADAGRAARRAPARDGRSAARGPPDRRRGTPPGQ